MPLISVTRLRVRSWRYMLSFIIHSNRSAHQAAAAQGNLGVMVLRDRRNAFWTMTAWQDESAMKSFMINGEHGAVMKKLLEWCDEAALVRWTHETADLPDWNEGHRRLQQQGRRSKVNHPSAAHDAYVIPPPVTGVTRDRRLK